MRDTLPNNHSDVRLVSHSQGSDTRRPPGGGGRYEECWFTLPLIARSFNESEATAKLESRTVGTRTIAFSFFAGTFDLEKLLV